MSKSMPSFHGSNESPRSILRRTVATPPVFDSARAERAWTGLVAYSQADGGGARSRYRAFIDHPRSREVLSAIFGNSGHLTRVADRIHMDLPGLFFDEPERLFDRALEDLGRVGVSGVSFDDLMSFVRCTKERAAFLIAAADITGVWDLFRVTDALTRLADAALTAALRWLLADAADAGKFTPARSDRPEAASGYAIIAMGKHGARELNYSSDIDMMVFFDETTLPTAPGVEPREFCVRLTKKLVRILQESTADGYAFRVDLRLRPDAGATPVAIPMDVAERYYESVGQNWERAAMIKARPAAGDIEAGTRFLTRLRPFVWRKYLDHAAIEDIHSIKRQIHRRGGHRAIGVPGHNIKLGLGGIREIEFFVQTQQLILGGRHEILRNRMTCAALEDLARAGFISRTAASELVASYVYLRTVEHRLQMREDAQTHTIPARPDELDNVARFSGYGDTEEFKADLLAHLTRINAHYNALFEKEDPLSSTEGVLVFTGVEDDPETVETLSRMGFERAHQVAATIRKWHFGRIRATRSKRARELLTKLVPVILESVAKTSDPDVTFARFQDFLAGMSSGVQLFALFFNRQDLLELVMEALGTAPRLGPYLAKNSGVLDALLDTDFLTTLPDRDDMSVNLESALKSSTSFEEILDASRRWGKDQVFRVGLQVLRGTLHADSAGKAFADLADTLIEALLPAALDDVAKSHGAIEDPNFAVVAMGKLGGRELSATSDVDLIFVYDHDGEEMTSGGARPVAVSRYFARVAQRFIAALSAPTAEGALYEVDMQLRPSGSSGPIAASFDAFSRYYDNDAWNWERLALTRARVVAGPPRFSDKVRGKIRRVLSESRNPSRLAKDVLDMRHRLAREKGTGSCWNLKQVRGGLIDLEFTCQYLQLIFASAHPQILNQNTCAVYRNIKQAELIPRQRAEDLLKAGTLMHSLTQVLRIAVDGRFRPDEAGDGLKALLVRVGGARDFSDLEARLVDAQRGAYSAFQEIVEAAA